MSGTLDESSLEIQGQVSPPEAKPMIAGFGCLGIQSVAQGICLYWGLNRPALNGTGMQKMGARFEFDFSGRDVNNQVVGLGIC